jgi:hypothetical protein
MEQELLTLPEHMSLPPVFNGVRITRSLVFLFILLSIDVCPFFFAHCDVCPSILIGEA